MLVVPSALSKAYVYEDYRPMSKVLVNFCGQIDWIWDQLRDKPLGEYVGPFPERLN